MAAGWQLALARESHPARQRAMDTAEDAAQRLCPVDTGALRETITGEADRDSMGGRLSAGDGVVDYASMSPLHLKYAAVDAVVTYLLFEYLNEKIDALGSTNVLSHKIQLMGAVGLSAIERNGICMNEDQRLLLVENLAEEMRGYSTVLKQYGWDGGTGVQKRMAALFDELKLKLPLTPGGQPSFSESSMAPHRKLHPAIDAKISFEEKKKLFDMLEGLKPDSVTTRVHSKFNTLVETGRTSSSRPNIQNISRDSAIRACFVPAQGSWFLIIDYSQIELCTLAQVCLDRYGTSIMADMINEGRDLHRWFASVLTGKAEADISKEERQRAKACNFGYPGGLGIEAFLDYARNTFGVSMTEEEARIYKQKWMSVFSEMQNYMQDTLFQSFSQKVDFAAGGNPEAAFGCFKRIIRGETWSSSGVPYPARMLENAFNVVLPQVAPDCSGIRVGSPDLASRVFVETVTSRTGRMRAKCRYTKARNTPFQGLAADGAKIALYYLTRAGYKLCNFIHDEFVIEVPENIEDGEIEAINEIALDAMHRVVPDIRLKTEWVLSTSWSKEDRIREGSRILSVPGNRAE